jgi:hypothetical protein
MDRFKEKRSVLPIEVMVVLAINIVVATFGYAVTVWGLSAIEALRDGGRRRRWPAIVFHPDWPRLGLGAIAFANGLLGTFACALCANPCAADPEAKYYLARLGARPAIGLETSRRCPVFFPMLRQNKKTAEGRRSFLQATPPRQTGEA